MKENPDREKANSALQHLGTNIRSMMGEELLNALSLVCIHRDIFLDYDKTIDIYASKYSRRMHLINPLSENWAAETFKASVVYAGFVSKENLIVLRLLLKD